MLHYSLFELQLPELLDGRLETVCLALQNSQFPPIAILRHDVGLLEILRIINKLMLHLDGSISILQLLCCLGNFLVKVDAVPYVYIDRDGARHGEDDTASRAGRGGRENLDVRDAFATERLG